MISPSATIKEAMRQMDQGAEKMLIVTDAQGGLLGTLTDGDLRRHILKEGSIEGCVGQCFNSDPVLLKDHSSLRKAQALMARHKITFLPVIDNDNRVCDILFWDKIGHEKVQSDTVADIPVVIMAGGKGTRLEPFTRILPKPLIPIGNKPILEIIMDKFNAYGIQEFFLTVNYKGEMIKSFFDNTKSKYKISYVWEKQFLGTAGSLSLLPENFSSPFIVTNCDIVLETNIADVLRFHQENENDITVIGSVQHVALPYGVIEFSQNGCIDKMREKPEFDITINTGVYVLNKDSVACIPKDTPIDMPELIAILMKQGRKVSVFPISEKSYIDIGQWAEYKKNIHALMA
ncbi:MAG: hypothetical protein VR64_11585 [Desulfatitalea sp. BRH_c12]|nr:MAG: hypothetical protein VR64_11585 [Desulfatitalea sp. BRH_c12]